MMTSQLPLPVILSPCNDHHCHELPGSGVQHWGPGGYYCTRTQGNKQRCLCEPALLCTALTVASRLSAPGCLCHCASFRTLCQLLYGVLYLRLRQLPRAYVAQRGGPGYINPSSRSLLDPNQAMRCPPPSLTPFHNQNFPIEAFREFGGETGSGEDQSPGKLTVCLLSTCKQ